MSRINGEKARAAIARKRRTAQRVKDRVGRLALIAASQKPAEPVKPVKKSVKKAVAVEQSAAAPVPAARPARKAKPAAENA